MEGVTVLIKLKTGEQLAVSKDLLISNSPVFKRLFVDLKFDEHVIDDFSPDSVRHFLTLLENGSLGDIEDNMFKEIHKLGSAFEVDWLRESCRDWLRDKMKSASSKEDKLYLFEECCFIKDKLKDEVLVNDLVEVFTHKDNSPLLRHYLSDMSKLEESQIDVLLQLGGGHVQLFLDIILHNLRGQNTLGPKLKYVLDNMNLAACCEINEGLYLEVMDTIAELADVSAADLRIVNKLITNTVKLVSTRKEEKKERATLMYESQKQRELLRSCKTVTDITSAVTKNLVTSMFVVIELLLWVFLKYTPTSEEQQIFIANLAKVCSNERLQKVSPQYLHTIISALKYSNLEQSEILVTLLTEMKHHDKLCTNNENVIIKRHKMIMVTEGREWKHLYKFKHPLSASCTQSDSKCGFILRSNIQKDNDTLKLCIDKEDYTESGIHFHDVISTQDMHCYVTHTGTFEGKQITLVGFWWWWKDWLPHITDWEYTGSYIAYNVSENLVAKRK